MAPDWQIVLTADGAVLAIAGGVPDGWVGTRIGDRQDVPPALRDAVRALLARLHGSVEPMATVAARGPADETIQLIAIEAVPLRRAAVDVRALLESVVQLMAPQARALDVELSLETDPRQPASMVLDPEKVSWAVTALVSNALRYVRRGYRLMPGGLIAMRTSHDPARSELSIAVDDDGVGIPEETVSQLFRRDAGRPLTAGLGLRLVNDVVAAHGGRVEVRSRTDAVHHGTTVQLIFPVL